MEKFLFTDGMNEVKEVQSQEELQTLIASSTSPDKIRIWVFNSNEWLTLTGLKKIMPGFLTELPRTTEAPVNNAALLNGHPVPSRRQPNGWAKKFLFFTIAAAAIFLVYNFTKVKWAKTAPVSITAVRPANVPVMDLDSLVQWIEDWRGQTLDKVTRTNLRIRNDWPNRILLKADASKDTSSSGSRFYNIELSIDNTTGYNIDQAVVKLSSWKNSEENNTDTFHLGYIGYASPAIRLVKGSYRGDSLSVSFQSIRAKSFNFCYSADKKSNYGNNNDRWFCRE